MPWTVADVDRFKKGLSDAQKRRWVRVANSALQRCKRDGGSDSSCEASAIRQANGVAGNEDQMQSYLSEACDYDIRYEDYQGEPHIVVPVIMMVEGVHHGSHGPMFHSIEELGKYPASWNDIPITIQHPQEDGIDISAGCPEVIETSMVGRVYNTYVQDNQLRGEAWINENKLRQVSPEALIHIQHKRPLDVSLGMFSDDDLVKGTWNEEAYIGISRNHRPDHLALLPDAKGACSWEDGCGIRNNEKGGKEMKDIKKVLIVDGFASININVDMQELVQVMNQKIDSMDNELRIHYMERLEDDYVIYKVVSREEGTTRTIKFLKRSYTYKDGAVAFTGDPVPVRKDISFTEINDNNDPANNTNSNNKEEGTMTDKTKGKPCCAEKVELLIQSDHSTFVEGDREWLNGLEEKTIDHFMEMQVGLETNSQKKTDTNENKSMTKEEALQVLSDTLADPEKFKSLLPKSIRDQFDHGLRVHEGYRKDLCQKILDNTEGVYEQADLDVLSDTALEKLATAIKVPVDHSLQGYGKEFVKSNAGSTEEVLMPMGMEE